MPPLIAAILIGGASRRYGSPKALAQIDGETLLQRTARIAAMCATETLLVGNPPFDMPPAMRHLRLAPDSPPGIGPIGGLAGAFAAAPGSAILLLACDMPQLDVRLLQRLSDSRPVIDRPGEGPLAVVSRTPAAENGPNAARAQAHPCAAIYLPPAAPVVARHINARIHRMHALLNELAPIWVDLPAEESHWLTNLNECPSR